MNHGTKAKVPAACLLRGTCGWSLNNFSLHRIYTYRQYVLITLNTLSVQLHPWWPLAWLAPAARPGDRRAYLVGTAGCERVPSTRHRRGDAESR